MSEKDEKPSLDWMEVALGAFVGVTRQIKHRFKGDQHRWYPDDDGNGWTRDIDAACAELYAARETGLYWHVGSDGKRDVGGHQVRHTPLAHGRMIVHLPPPPGGHPPRDPKTDNPDDVIMLVTGTAPNFVLVGWEHARNCNKPEWWDDPTGKKAWAYFVPQRELRPMSELPKK